MTTELDWLETEEDTDDVQIEEYDLTSSPNDFNVLTISSFIESGAVKIPGFQRNYVWDIKRASKLIESLIIGLPVPQIFLYEEARNRFLVIDGQQRLMSIFYFIRQRFPRKDKRGELRRLFDEHGDIPETVLEDDRYFERFALKLPEVAPGRPNKFAGRVYGSLDEYKTQFDLRTIRNVIVKQDVPKDDDSSIYEMFSRLNTGGINLTPQEIRASLYHSAFYDMLSRANTDSEWRRLLGQPQPELHMRDTEVLLRGFAMAISGRNYGSSMAKFLNTFSKQAKGYSEASVGRLERAFHDFLDAARSLPIAYSMGRQASLAQRHLRLFSPPLWVRLWTTSRCRCCSSSRRSWPSSSEMLTFLSILLHRRLTGRMSKGVSGGPRRFCTKHGRDRRRSSYGRAPRTRRVPE